MPIHRAGKGWQWGNHGKVYAEREGAERQAGAAHASGYGEKGEMWRRRSKMMRGASQMMRGVPGKPR